MLASAVARRRLLAREQESASGSHIFRAYDSADGVRIYLPMLLAAPTDVLVGKLGSGLRFCDSLSLATVVLLNDFGTAALESQNRKPHPGFVFLGT